MRTRFSLGAAPLFCALALFVVTASACGARPGCVIDTDCPLGQFCSDQRCEPLGASADSGGVVDAARVDAGGVDAAAPSDGGSVDGGASDTGSPDAGACMGVPGTYTLSSSPAACPTLISAITVAAGADACTVTLSSRDEATFGGDVTSTGGSTFTGVLSIGMTSFPDCTVTFSPSALNVDCGSGCVLPATMP
jgi:hypothetical protein